GAGEPVTGDLQAARTRQLDRKEDLALGDLVLLVLLVVDVDRGARHDLRVDEQVADDVRATHHEGSEVDQRRVPAGREGARATGIGRATERAGHRGGNPDANPGPDHQVCRGGVGA